MDFLNLLIPKEKIIGMEISDWKIRLLFLEKDAYGKIKISGEGEADIEKGIIINGVIKDSVRLKEALDKARKSFVPAKAWSNFIIIAISQKGVYSEIFEFPKDLTGGQLLEAISLNAAANLPIPFTECYIDWQVIRSENNKNKVLVSLISKKTVDGYINALKEKNFNLIALEPISLSLSRSVDLPDDSVVFLYFTDDGLTSIVYKDKIPYLSQYESWTELSGDKPMADISSIAAVLKVKIKSLINYFETEYKNDKIKKVFIASDEAGIGAVIESIGAMPVAIEEAKKNVDSLKNNGWLKAAGAAKRAFVSRGEDMIISLLPVGTETLYDAQKAVSFIKSIFLLLVSLSVFYTLVFFAYFVFVSSMESRVNAQLEARNKVSLPPEYQKIDAETREFNGYAHDLLRITSAGKKDYAKILEDINTLSSPRVYLTGISLGKSADYVSVSGVAATRENLDAFKYQIDNSDFFKEAKYSIQNIAQKNNIPFSVSLYLK